MTAAGRVEVIGTVQGSVLLVDDTFFLAVESPLATHALQGGAGQCLLDFGRPGLRLGANEASAARNGGC